MAATQESSLPFPGESHPPRREPRPSYGSVLAVERGRRPRDLRRSSRASGANRSVCTFPLLASIYAEFWANDLLMHEIDGARTRTANTHGKSVKRPDGVYDG